MLRDIKCKDWLMDIECKDWLMDINVRIDLFSESV
jgi:hypothetical protein